MLQRPREEEDFFQDQNTLTQFCFELGRSVVQSYSSKYSFYLVDPKAVPHKLHRRVECEVKPKSHMQQSGSVLLCRNLVVQRVQNTLFINVYVSLKA